MGVESYDLTIKMAALSVNDLLEKFGVEVADLIDSNLEAERNALGLPTLNMQSPKITGIFSPGDGFEIIATGTISSPELAAEASSFYVIVQDFKKSTQAEGDASEVSYGKPIAGIFAQYDKAKVTDILMQLTNVNLAKLNFLRDDGQVAITLASKIIAYINTEELRDLASKFIPDKGLDFMDKGLTVMHHAANTNSDITDNDNNVRSSALVEFGFIQSLCFIMTSSKLANFIWNLFEILGQTLFCKLCSA